MNERTEVWLRFIGYKLAELLAIGIFSIGSYYLGKLMISWMPKESQVQGWFISWITGIFGIVAVGAVIGLIVIWVIKNWEWANEDTEARRASKNKKR